MEITAEMLFYRLSRHYSLQMEQIGGTSLSVRHIRILADEKCLEQDTLYILSDMGDLEGISVQEPGMFLFCHMPAETVFPAAFSQKNTYAVLAEQISPVILQITLLEEINALLRWDARLSQAALRCEDLCQAMSLGREMLEWEYVITDLDMKNLYVTPGYGNYTNEDMDYVPLDEVHALMMDPEYHSAAELKESFYYYGKIYDFKVFCGNIFLNGQFYSRIIMRIGTKDSTIPSGAREIFDVFVSHIEACITHSTIPFSRYLNSQLHSLFRTLTDGGIPDPAFCSSVLKKMHWQKNDSYMIIKLHFYEAAGWNTQFGTTLLYLIRELEHEWKNTCAIVNDQTILWLINISQSGIEQNWNDFHQQFVIFMREHVCVAGVSSKFHDFTQIPYAIQTADTALRIGQAKNPDIWCHLFDDYRLEYMLEKISGTSSNPLLCHPAILQLADYDNKNGTELNLTLLTYLRCNLNMTEAANQIFIHRTTFCRRMNHICRLTEIDINDPDTVLELLLSYRLFPVSHSCPPYKELC